jgi:hypothetical protein
VRRGIAATFVLLVLVGIATAAGADSGLRNADQAERDAEAKAAIKGTIGKPVKVGSLLLTVRGVAFHERMDPGESGERSRVSR